MIRLASPRCLCMMVSAMATLLLFTLILSYHTRYPYSLRGDGQPSPFGVLRPDKGQLDNAASDWLSELDRNSSISEYNVSQPFNDEDFECIRTRTRPSFTVCLYNIWRDVFISRSLQSAGIWEPYVVDEFIEAVKRSGSSSGVLDVGANIGYYTLLAARIGHKVVAVEPMLDSIKRLHRAAQIDRTADNIRVVHNAVAERRTRATLRPDGDNQGDARIQLWVKDCTGTCPTTIDTIILDDLADFVPFRQAVMKIDIQGYEHLVFQRASKLFRAVHFTHIFMEWMVMKDFYVSANHTSTDKHLVQKMIRLLFRFDYRPYKLVYEGGHALDPNDWGSWPLDVVWHRLPNKNEKERMGMSHFKNWPL